MVEQPDHEQPIDFAALGYIKCEGGWRSPAYPNDPPFTEDELRRHLEVAAKLPKSKRRARRT